MRESVQFNTYKLAMDDTMTSKHKNLLIEHDQLKGAIVPETLIEMEQSQTEDDDNDDGHDHPSLKLPFLTPAHEKMSKTQHRGDPLSKGVFGDVQQQVMDDLLKGKGELGGLYQPPFPGNIKLNNA